MEYKFKKQIIESLIFASDTPVPESRLIKLVEELDKETCDTIIRELTAEYQATNRAFIISRLGGGYQIVTRPEFAPWVKMLFGGKIKTRLSQAALEVLAIVAFKQPISRPQIEAIRGAQCDGVVKNLLERNLIAIAGRSESVGRPLIYKTTGEFLRHFGINEISDLPKPKEISELVTDNENLLDSVQVLSSQMGQRDLFNSLELDQENPDLPSPDDTTE